MDKDLMDLLASRIDPGISPIDDSAAWRAAFAEIIAAECAEIADREHVDGSDGETVANAIRIRFGLPRPLWQQHSGNPNQT